MSADRTRVLQIITRMNVGGATRNVIKLQERLLAENFESTIVWGTESTREGMIPPPGVEHVKIPSLQREISPMNDWRAYRAIERLIVERRPHVVHTHMAKAGALGRIAASRTGVPVVLHTYHGHVLEGYFSGPRSRLFLGAERRLAKRTSALVAVSPQIRDELRSLGIGKDEQWHALPLSLDLDALVSSTLDRDAARERLGLPSVSSGRLLVGIVGRLAPIKRVDIFLEAAAIVAREIDDVEFVVAGDGEERDGLERRGRELLGPRVHFLGWVSDLEALYASLDIAALTSRNEGTPVALIEAGVMGVPAVATSVGGVPDVVVDERTGLLVRTGDPRDIADAIVRIARDADLRRRLGEEARRALVARYAGPGPIEAILDLYRSLLARFT